MYEYEYVFVYHICIHKVYGKRVEFITYVLPRLIMYAALNSLLLYTFSPLYHLFV